MAWPGFELVAAAAGRPATRRLHLALGASSFSLVPGAPPTAHAGPAFRAAAPGAAVRRSDPDGHVVDLLA